MSDTNDDTRLHPHEGSNSAAAGQLRAIVERIERVETGIAELNGDKKDIYAEAKANGFDVPTIKRVIALRRKDDAERKEQEALLELYLANLGMA